VSNQREFGPFRTEFVNLVIAFDALLMVCIVPLRFAIRTPFIPGRKLLLLLCRNRLWRLLNECFELGLFATKKGLQSFGKVRKPMPAVGDLLRLWRSAFRSFRIRATAISADDLDALMFACATLLASLPRDPAGDLSVSVAPGQSRSFRSFCAYRTKNHPRRARAE
jgi:hypothetical protein